LSLGGETNEKAVRWNFKLREGPVLMCDGCALCAEEDVWSASVAKKRMSDDSDSDSDFEPTPDALENENEVCGNIKPKK
jgi:hypothetical protein